MEAIDGRLLGGAVAPDQAAALGVVGGRSRRGLDAHAVVVELDRRAQVLAQRVRVLAVGAVDADERPRLAVEDVVAQRRRQRPGIESGARERFEQRAD